MDWPCLFYAICILRLVIGGLGDAEHWTNAYGLAAMEMEDSLYGLCQIFHFCTNNIQPLSSNFDIGHYASLVDDNELAVKHYYYMCQLWETHSMLPRKSGRLLG